jgi:hypothetical protein
MARVPRLALVLAVCGAALGCAQEIIERPAKGPTALDFFVARSFLVNGREPNFDERRMWEDKIDEQIRVYLRDHPELQQSARYSDIRFWRQVTAGSTREEVRILLDEPDERSVDPAALAVMARQHWPDIQAKAKEGWSYGVAGWTIFFDERGVTEMLRRLSTTTLPDD